MVVLLVWSKEGGEQPPGPFAFATGVPAEIVVDFVNRQHPSRPSVAGVGNGLPA